MINFEWLLFDIGGVLVKFKGVPRILEWMNWRVDREEMNRMWLYSEAVRAFETGKTTPLEFAYAMVKEFKFSVSAEEFLEGFPFFIDGLYPGVEGFLQKLSGKYPIAALSNINEIHWGRLCIENNFDQLIPTIFLSFKTGYMKPDKDTYLKVIEDLKCEADKIIFFDDNEINVQAARDVGINSVLVTGFDDLKRKIAGMGILEEVG